MADFIIHVENDHMDEIIAECHRRALAALQLCGAQCERNAKINLEKDPRRVDTGLLRNSITYGMANGETAIKSYKSNTTHGNTDSTTRRGIAGTPVKNPGSGSYAGTLPDVDGSDQAVYVGTNVEYGIYVHEGTQRMAPNRFLRNAMGEHIPEYKAIIEKVLKGGQ